MLELLLDALKQAYRQAEKEGLLLYKIVRMETESESLLVAGDLVTKGVKRAVR